MGKALSRPSFSGEDTCLLWSWCLMCGQSEVRHGSQGMSAGDPASTHERRLSSSRPPSSTLVVAVVWSDSFSDTLDERDPGLFVDGCVTATMSFALKIVWFVLSVLGKQYLPRSLYLHQDSTLTFERHPTMFIFPIALKASSLRGASSHLSQSRQDRHGPRCCIARPSALCRSCSV